MLFSSSLSECPYCKETLPQGARNQRFHRCESCKRLLFFARNLWGKPRRVEQVGVAFLIFLPIAIPLIGVLCLTRLLTGSDAVVFAGVSLLVAAMGAPLVHDGYLSMKTRIHNVYAYIARGREAVFWGWVEILLGLAIVVVGIGCSVCSIIRGITGEWPL